MANGVVFVLVLVVLDIDCSCSVLHRRRHLWLIGPRTTDRWDKFSVIFPRGELRGQYWFR